MTAKPVSILYVEDSDDLRAAICMLLEDAGAEVVACASGEEAIRILLERNFDIVMTDVSLPGMSGTELARHVLATHPHQWVVLCSGYEFPHGLQALGVHVRSLPKGFELYELEALLKEILEAIRGSSVGPPDCN
jgi:CheY-like chemotaxis protein